VIAFDNEFKLSGRKYSATDGYGRRRLNFQLPTANCQLQLPKRSFRIF
jgi:hypothetical protein